MAIQPRFQRGYEEQLALLENIGNYVAMNLLIADLPQRAAFKFHRTPPSYLTPILNCQKPIIIASAMKFCEPSSNESTPQRPVCEAADSNSGSPLRSPILDDDYTLIGGVGSVYQPEDIPEPLAVNFALRVQIIYSQHMSTTEMEAYPVVFICEGGVEGDEFVLMMWENAHKRRMFSYKEEQCGLSKLAQLRDKAISFSLKHIYELEATTSQSPLKLSCRRYVEYQFTLTPGVCFKVFVDWIEKRSTIEIQLPPPVSSPVCLQAPLLQKYDHWKIGVLAKEIRVLFGLVKYLHASYNDQSLINSIDQDSNIDPLQHIREIIGRQKIPTPDSKYHLEEYKDLPKEYILGIYLNIVLRQARPNTDFTDVLWNYFKYAKSVPVVVNGIKAILEEFLISDVHVLSNNPTYLGEIAIRVAMHRDYREIPLSLDYIQLLIEAGFIKLMRDCIFILSKTTICTPEQVKLMCGYSPDMAGNWNQEKWVQNLKKLHQLLLTVEIMARCSQPFLLNVEALRSLMNAAYNTKPGQTFTAKLHSENFEKLINDVLADIYRWSFHTFDLSNNNTTTSTLACSFNKPFFPWLKSTKSEFVDKKAKKVKYSPPLSELVGDDTIPSMYCAMLHTIEPNSM